MKQKQNEVKNHEINVSNENIASKRGQIVKYTTIWFILLYFKVEHDFHLWYGLFGPHHGTGFRHRRVACRIQTFKQSFRVNVTI